jgi:hypothetical protein
MVAAQMAFLCLMAMSPQLSVIFLHPYALIVNESRGADSPLFSSPCNMARQVPQER